MENKIPENSFKKVLSRYYSNDAQYSYNYLTKEYRLLIHNYGKNNQTLQDYFNSDNLKFYSKKEFDSALYNYIQKYQVKINFKHDRTIYYNNKYYLDYISYSKIWKIRFDNWEETKNKYAQILNPYLYISKEEKEKLKSDKNKTLYYEIYKNNQSKDYPYQISAYNKTRKQIIKDLETILKILEI